MKAAFVVGVSVYSSLSPLSACASDASIIESLLKATNKYEKIKVLKDNTSSDKVKSSLRSFVKELLEQEQSVEELFIYFSGHGYQNSNELFLCCSNFNQKLPETTSLLNSELDELIRTINPELTVKVFDACQSGYQYIKDTDILRKNLSPNSGIEKFIFMASCSQQESSFADQNLSFFTRVFFEGVVNQKVDGDIYYRDIQSHIADSFQKSPEQTPLFVTQTNGLEVFGTMNSSIEKLRIEHQQLIQQKVKTKSFSARVLDAIEDLEQDYITPEKVNALLQEIEPSKLKISLSDEINRSLYQIDQIDSISIQDINSAKLIATTVSKNKWSDDCFITIEKEAYKVRQLRDDLPFFATFSLTTPIRSKSDDTYYETVTKYRPCDIKVNEQVPFDCLRIKIRPLKLCLHPWHSFLFILPARTYCVLAIGFVKLDRYSWDEFQLEPSEIEWVFQELLWRDWSNNSPTKTLMLETEKRIKQDIIKTTGITINSEYEIDELENPDIQSFDYDAEQKALRIVFNNGNVYKYADVPESIYQELKETSSVGQYFNSQIKDKFT
ncbi:MAG: KTSC domain-containing protein, partial [Cyanobacteria bacterium P01_G01_bin.39]